MTWPTGSLSVVVEFFDQARQCEKRAEHMVENDCWNTAIEQKLEAEKLKAQGGMEFFLWLVATLQMPVEPNPWNELQEKLAKEKAEKEKKAE